MPQSVTDPVVPDAPVSLVLPFGAIGLVGGWLTADAFGLGGDSFLHGGHAIRCLLTSVTPISAALLGGYLTVRLGGADSPGAEALGERRWARKGALMTGLLVLRAVVLAGVGNSMAIGLLLAPPAGALLGIPFGALCALPFVPALAAVLFAATRVGRARPGSIIAASDRRAVWSATAAVIALGVLAMRAIRPPPVAPELGVIVAGLACAAVVAMFMADAVALARVAALGRARFAGADGGGREGDENEVEIACDERVDDAIIARAGVRDAVDFGIGDETQVERVRPKHAYRGAQRITRVVRGSHEQAAAALRAGLARAGIALAVGAGIAGLPWWSCGGG